MIATFNQVEFVLSGRVEDGVVEDFTVELNGIYMNDLLKFDVLQHLEQEFFDVMSHDDPREDEFEQDFEKEVG